MTVLPWWGWTLVWGALVVGGAAVIGWRLRWLWHRSTAFLAALDAASDTLAAVETRADEARRAADGVAVLEDPWRLRAEYAAARDGRRAARRARREEQLPTWARPRRR